MMWGIICVVVGVIGFIELWSLPNNGEGVWLPFLCTGIVIGEGIRHLIEEGL